jgi:beta-lactam-binding protein with PASTA domain
MTLADATTALEGDGFDLGTVTPQPDGFPGGPDSIVVDQDPNPGVKRAPGTDIDLVVTDPASLATCPP